MTSRRDVLKVGATMGALVLPGTLAAESSHSGHAGHGAPAQRPAVKPAPPPAKGFQLKFDGLCAAVQLMSGSAIKALDVGLVDNAISTELVVRPHIPTL